MLRRNHTALTLAEALAPFAVAITLLAIATYCFGEQAGQMYYQRALLISSAVAAGIARRKGIAWEALREGVVSDVKPLLPTLRFILFIGMLSTAWLLSGLIPSMVYYALQYLPSVVFLPGTVMATALMGVLCGSSWLTVATMGVVFLKVGEALGFSPPLVAGAVISGAYFGDKLTPLSETTVLAASMSQAPLMRHVRCMLSTSLPAFGLALLLFTLWGLSHQMATTPAIYREEVLLFLENTFAIHWSYLVVLLAIVGMTIYHVRPSIVLGTGVLLSGLIALYAQSYLLDSLLHQQGMEATIGRRIGVLIAKIFRGVEIPSDIASHDGQTVWTLSAGGIWGMWSTLTIILASMLFSGVMEGSGLLHRFVHQVGNLSSRPALVGFTLLTAIFFNITVADQYLAIILTSKMFTPLFLQQGLAREQASRTVEDAATVTSPLVPWNTCGIAQSKILGIPTLHYAPYCFFNLLSPLYSFLRSLWQHKKRGTQPQAQAPAGA